MMLKNDNNFKSEGNSSYNFANMLRCASAHCEQAAFCKGSFRANRTRRSLDKSLYSKITGWSLAMLAVCGVFSYLTFIPNQAFAADDIVDPNEHRSLSQIDTMQEMSQQICINSHEKETKQLEDTREPGKKYWVTKLKDGNCWMTQNLDFDIPATLSEETSDVTGTSVATGITGSTAISSWSDTTDTANFYNNPGNYYYSGPNGKHNQGTTNSCSEVTSLADSKCSSLYKSINPSDASANNQENMHYHVGNYYTWDAATVRSKSGVMVNDSSYNAANNASMSICPKGWQLPTSNNTNSKSFGGLMNAYSDTSNISNNSHSSPLYFVHGGLLYNGRLFYGGYYGKYWSSTPNRDRAYHLFLNGGSFNSSDDSFGRYNGFSVRCVTAGGWLLDDNQASVAINVSPVISIDVTKHANDMTVDFTKVATSTIITRVGSNQPYQLLLSTDKSDLTNPDTDKTIPMIPSDQTIVKGTNSWGIKKLSSPTDTEVNENTIYSPVGINGNKALFYTSDSAASEDLTFPVAIAVDSSLPSGQYSTQVTLTAVAM